MILRMKKCFSDKRMIVRLLVSICLFFVLFYVVMQYVYYIFEFTVVAFMVDCAQKTSIKFGWTQKIPWGGIFIAITWGFGHYFSKGTLLDGFSSMALCIFIGLAYMLPGKKPIYAWLAVAAGYWLT